MTDDDDRRTTTERQTQDDDDDDDNDGRTKGTSDYGRRRTDRRRTTTDDDERQPKTEFPKTELLPYETAKGAGPGPLQQTCFLPERSGTIDPRIHKSRNQGILDTKNL